MVLMGTFPLGGSANNCAGKSLDGLRQSRPSLLHSSSNIIDRRIVRWSVDFVSSSFSWVSPKAQSSESHQDTPSFFG
jgi:hypothetical protein